jgi:hypothetical protein
MVMKRSNKQISKEYSEDPGVDGMIIRMDLREIGWDGVD